MRKSYIITLLILTLTKQTSSTAAGQETLIGIKGKDFIMIGADSSMSGNGGISITSNSVDKIHEITTSILLATAGDIADCDYINSVVSTHAKIREFEGVGHDVQYVINGEEQEFGLDVNNIAHLARNEISYRLRNLPLRVNLLVAGMVPYYNTNKPSEPSLLSQRIHSQISKTIQLPPQTDKTTDNETNNEVITLKPQLYWLDEYGSNQNIPYSVHGYASNFALSILDQNYHAKMNKEEVLALMKECFYQLRTRYIINTESRICVKCVDRFGVSTFEI